MSINSKTKSRIVAVIDFLTLAEAGPFPFIMTAKSSRSNPGIFFLLALSLGLKFVVAGKPEVDPNGYIMFCPCMGKSPKLMLGIARFSLN